MNAIVDMKDIFGAAFRALLLFFVGWAISDVMKLPSQFRTLEVAGAGGSTGYIAMWLVWPVGYAITALLICRIGRRAGVWIDRNYAGGHATILVGAYFLGSSIVHGLGAIAAAAMVPRESNRFLELVWGKVGDWGLQLGPGVGEALFAAYCLYTGFRDVEGISVLDRVAIADAKSRGELDANE